MNKPLLTHMVFEKNVSWKESEPPVLSARGGIERFHATASEEMNLRSASLKKKWWFGHSGNLEVFRAGRLYSPVSRDFMNFMKNRGPQE